MCSSDLRDHLGDEADEDERPEHRLIYGRILDEQEDDERREHPGDTEQVLLPVHRRLHVLRLHEHHEGRDEWDKEDEEAFIKGEPGHHQGASQPAGEGNVFTETIFGGSVPRQYIPAVEKGTEETLAAGILAGFPVVGVHATVYDGSYHEVDSSEMAFHIAGSMAFKDAMAKADPVLLEPIMKVEVTMPEEYMGDVIGDINSRRGRVEGMDTVGNGRIVKAYVPLSEMFGYSTDLRSKTQGRGNYSMFFEKYEQVPKSVQEKVISSRAK